MIPKRFHFSEPFLAPLIIGGTLTVFLFYQSFRPMPPFVMRLAAAYGFISASVVGLAVLSLISRSLVPNYWSSLLAGVLYTVAILCVLVSHLFPRYTGEKISFDAIFQVVSGFSTSDFNGVLPAVLTVDMATTTTEILILAAVICIILLICVVILELERRLPFNLRRLYLVPPLLLGLPVMFVLPEGAFTYFEPVRLNITGQRANNLPAVEIVRPEFRTSLVLPSLEKLTDFYRKLFANKIPISTAANLPDILIIGVEGLRYDNFSPEYMPLLFRRAQGSSWRLLPYHFTSGTNSGTGLFGLISAMDAVFYPVHIAEQQNLYPLRILKEHGYLISVFFTRSMEYQQMGKLLFKDVSDHYHQEPFQADTYDAEWDRAMLNSYLKVLENHKSSSKPRFDYLHFYSTHYNYYYPHDFEFFRPVLRPEFKIENGLGESFRDQQDLLRNRYRNSVRYLDSLIDILLISAEKRSQERGLVVFITGDHGEEFWERGHFGHTFDTNKYQSQVVGVLKIGKPVRCPLSSHIDIFPTIFDVLGIGDKVSHLMDGKSLLDDCPEKVVSISRGIYGAVPARRQKLVYGDVKLFFERVRDLDLRGITDLEETVQVYLPEPDITRIFDLYRQRFDENP